MVSPTPLTLPCILLHLTFFPKASAPEDIRLLSNFSFHYEKCEHLDFIAVEEKLENEKTKAYKPSSLTKKKKKNLKYIIF